MLPSLCETAHAGKMCVGNLRSSFGLEQGFTDGELVLGPFPEGFWFPATCALAGPAAGRSQGVLSRAGETVPSSALETRGGMDEREPGRRTPQTWSSEAEAGGRWGVTGASTPPAGAPSSLPHVSPGSPMLPPHGNRISPTESVLTNIRNRT